MNDISTVLIAINVPNDVASFIGQDQAEWPAAFVWDEKRQRQQWLDEHQGKQIAYLSVSVGDLVATPQADPTDQPDGHRVVSVAYSVSEKGRS